VASSSPVSVRDLARIAIFAAIIAVLGLPGAIPLGAGLAPITAQTLGVMLAGAVLGAWRGAAAVAVFEVLVLAGLPLLSGGRGGAAVFAGPTVGYLIGWIVGAFVIGLIAKPSAAKLSIWRLVVGLVVGGIVVVYAFGIPFFAAISGYPLAAVATGNAVYLVGDSIKVVVAALIVLGLSRAYPKALQN